MNFTAARRTRFSPYREIDKAQKMEYTIIAQFGGAPASTGVIGGGVSEPWFRIHDNPSGVKINANNKTLAVAA